MEREKVEHWRQKKKRRREKIGIGLGKKEKDQRKVGKRVGSLTGFHTKYITGTTELRTRMHGALCSIAISLLAFQDPSLHGLRGRRRDSVAGIRD
jgi:hypothetical protein